MITKTFTVSTKTAKIVNYLRATCGVRYWEDTEVNGEPDTEGDKIPCRIGEIWGPVINLNTGIIEDWPKGVTASVHYKVCDAGKYELLDIAKQTVATIEGYVPEIMCPKEGGYGDYVIMEIDGDGKIADWKVTLAEFEHD